MRRLLASFVDRFLSLLLFAVKVTAGLALVLVFPVFCVYWSDAGGSFHPSVEVRDEAGVLLGKPLVKEIEGLTLDKRVDIVVLTLPGPLSGSLDDAVLDYAHRQPDPTALLENPVPYPERFRDSLVILDEIGRGTSTFDGMSIARAVVEHIDGRIHAKTLFATHYHELTEMENERIRNYCIAVREKGKNVVFLRRIVAGAADKSYGIHVARLAGLPQRVTERAEEILHALEAAAPQSAPQETSVQKTSDAGMASLFAGGTLDELRALDVMTMTPLEALNTLYRLQEQARKEEGEG